MDIIILLRFAYPFNIRPFGLAPVSPLAVRAASSKSGVRSMLTAFLSKRPDRQDLRSKGIVKERMFGCDLAEHLVNARRDGLLLLLLHLLLLLPLDPLARTPLPLSDSSRAQ